jgi:hypothetical protein
LHIDDIERAYRAREVMHTPPLPALPNWAPTISLADGLAKMAAT